MTDETLVSLAKEYMQKMGIRDTHISLPGTTTRSIRTFTSFSTVWITTDVLSATGDDCLSEYQGLQGTERKVRTLFW